jgi:RNA polymerase sigma-70 factor, ECF subfamily
VRAGGYGGIQEVCGSSQKPAHKTLIDTHRLPLNLPLRRNFAATPQPHASKRLSGSPMPYSPDTSDVILLSRLAERDQEALLALYRRYQLRVFSLILRITKNRPMSEEILQDVFFRLWSRPEAYGPEKGQLLSWLLVVAKNLSLDRLRGEIRRGSGSVFSLDDLRIEARLPEPDLDQQRSLRAVLDELPPAQREALELIYFEGLTHVELAERTGEPLGTVKTRVRLGMAKLKDALRITSFTWS